MAEESVDSSGGPAPFQRWKEIAQLKDVAIFENARVLPRVWLAHEVKVLTGPEILNVVRTAKLPDGKEWNPRDTALVEGLVDFKPTADKQAEAQITSHEPNRILVKTKSSEPAILIQSENHYPGWRAYVDGRLVETLRVDYNLRGVTLPAGEHNVELVYRPKSVLIGAAISLLTLIGLVFWWRRWLPEERLARMIARRGD